MGLLTGLSNWYDEQTRSLDLGVLEHHPGNVSLDTNLSGSTMESIALESKVARTVFGLTAGPALIGKGPQVLWMIAKRAEILELAILYGIQKYQFERYQNVTQSPGQDGKPGDSSPSVPPKTSGGTKPSKPTRSGSTSKPFWSSGKPKCKKGFRYDFKRKLCVKIK
jgi:hypothetical protein